MNDAARHMTILTFVRCIGLKKQRFASVISKALCYTHSPVLLQGCLSSPKC